METGKTSLRWLIGKWLGPSDATPARVTRIARSRVNRSGCVRVEMGQGAGQLAMFFFRHGDGSWCVFPQ